MCDLRFLWQWLQTELSSWTYAVQSERNLPVQWSRIFRTWQSLSWLWNSTPFTDLRIHYHIYKIPWLDFMLSKLNLTLIFNSYFLGIHSNIILLFMPVSPKLFHCFSWLKFYNHFYYFSLLCFCHTLPNLLNLITLYLVSYNHFGSPC